MVGVATFPSAGGEASGVRKGMISVPGGTPVGKVYTSLFNRAYETAVLAGFTDIEKTADLTEGGLVVSPNENNRRAEALRNMLGVAPKPGTSTVVITHKPNIVDALVVGHHVRIEGDPHGCFFQGSFS